MEIGRSKQSAYFFMKRIKTDRPLCKKCNTKLAYKKGINRLGIIIWSNKCWKCRDEGKLNRQRYFRKKKAYYLRKKNYCEKCKFKAEHRCQLDIDHIDGNHDNNSLNNLMTLCANCHRLKTFLNKDWEE